MRAFAAAPILLAVSISASAKPTSLRVRVFKSLPRVELRGVSLALEASGSSWATVGLTSLQISWASGYWRLKSAEAPVTASVAGDSLAVKGAFLQVLGKRITDEARLVRGSNGRIDVIVTLPIEEYLAGVIPSEMPVHWPAEALKAQAVAARSFALRMARVRRQKPFDVDSTVYDQVHRFEQDIELKSPIKDKLRQVLSETRGQILLDESDHILKAFYSADCGCATEDPKYVWGADKHFESVRDPTCGQRRVKSWRTSINRRDLRGRLIRALGLPENAELKTVQVGGRSPSGRVSFVMALVEVHGKAVSRQLTSQQFRRLVGFEKIHSANFALQWLGDELQIRGEGVGHGVGLCQTGARSLAQNGANYLDILKLYYPRTKLKSL